MAVSALAFDEGEWKLDADSIWYKKNSLNEILKLWKNCALIKIGYEKHIITVCELKNIHSMNYELILHCTWRINKIGTLYHKAENKNCKL